MYEKKSDNKCSVRTLKTLARKKGARNSKKIRAQLMRKRLDQTSAAKTPTLSTEKIKSLAKMMKTKLTRREVLKAGAITAGAAAMPGLLAACGSGNGGGNPPAKATETRTFVFDFSWADTDTHDVVLAAGTKYHTLLRATAEDLIELRKTHPILERLPDEKITHHIKVEMPANAIQLCYLQRFEQGADDGRWDMMMMFIHHPISALQAAIEKEKGLLGTSELHGEFHKVSDKWSKYGLTGQDMAQQDPVALDAFKDCCDTACTMITGHPEMMCLDPNNSAYIQNTITSQNSAQLSQIIELLGPAEPQANWSDCSTPYQANASGYATLVPLCNPDTGKQATNSKTGALQYMPSYSDTTNTSLNSDGMMPSLASAKQDTTLGANVTTDPDATQGLIWRSQDGVTTSTQTESLLGENSDFSYDTKDFSPGHGYSITVTDVDDSPTNTNLDAVVTIEAKNWYVRYLGLYIRYLDSNGDTIPIQNVIDDIGEEAFNEAFELSSLNFNTSTDAFLDLLSPEFELYGMPISETKKSFDIPMPKSATSILVLGSGMGASNSDSNPFGETTALGATMTGVVSLGLTMFFLVMQAAEGIAPFIEALEENENLITFLPIFIELFVASVEALAFDDPAAFIGLGVELGNILLGSGSTALVTFMIGFIEEAEIASEALDAIPIFGLMFSAIIAIGTLTQLATSASDVMVSPSTYAFEINLTHDIEVTVRPNLSPPPDGNPSGWPATATHFDVIAQFDGGTPTSVRGELPATQTTDPQTVTFVGVPLGGDVAMSVGVYSDNDFLVGNANSATKDNQEDVTFDITFKEVLIPLVASTVYSHKEVIELDASGNHIWVATTTPPTQEAKGCSPSNGQLCSLSGITINTAAAGIGQSYQSYNDAVPTCTSASSFSNAYQFSNISSTQDPQSEFFFSGCTFSSSPRLVYDLMSRPDNNFYLDTDSSGPNYHGVIRQVRLDTNNNPGFDGPDSNLAWGKLQHPSDSLLLHPAGKIISIANTKNKFEVIELPNAARSDLFAPFSHTYSAKGLRPGLLNGPVLAALDPDGTILVIEAGNKRIQAFDLNGNAAPIFPNGAYFVPLKEQTVKQYLDFAVEFKGYMFVLLIVDNGGADVFTLDIYNPDGSYLATTTGFEAQRLAINYWRDIYTQNSQVLKLPNGALPARTEPSISHWIPSTP